MQPVRPSTLRLPADRPSGVSTIFDYFVGRFPQIPEPTWRARFLVGKVWTVGGAVDLDTPFQPLLDVFYRREVEHEPPVREDFRVVWADQHLMVVDKPPNLPVTPGGRWVRGCLLHLLGATTGNPHIAPLHRLDRLSSGLLLLSVEPESRSRFSRLMRTPSPVVKTYTAVCERIKNPSARGFALTHHVAQSLDEPWRQEVRSQRPANARADATVLAEDGDLVLLRVRLHTGRKHQIRVQLAHEGLPILGDPLYGTQPPYRVHDLAQRVWLDAHQLVVCDFCPSSDQPPLNAVWFSSREPMAFFDRARVTRQSRTVERATPSD